MGSEKTFENKVKKFLEEQGCYFVKYWGGGQFTKAGIPDILCSCNGLFIGIEIKAPNGKPSPLQIHNLKKIDESGGLAILLYPKDFEKFKKLVHEINAHNPKEVVNTYMELWKVWWEYADKL